MKNSLQTVTEKFNRLEAITRVKLEDLKAKQDSYSQLKSESELLEETILLARKCLESVLDTKDSIENIISEGLSEVFGINYSFILEPVWDDSGLLKGLKPKVSNGVGEYEDPLDSEGTGAVAIASICLRIAILLLNRKTAKLIVLDEPFANLSLHLQQRFKAFIETICEKTGLQMVLVTHMDEPFGKVWIVKKVRKGKKEKSIVEEYG